MTRPLPREILPIPDVPYAGPTMYDARNPDAKYKPVEPLRPPEGAPNIFLVLIDDAGFGSNSAFGGPCRTPHMEFLAQHGLRYTRFHTTAICSSTRQALLTGRNHHSVGMGTVSARSIAKTRRKGTDREAAHARGHGRDPEPASDVFTMR